MQNFLFQAMLLPASLCLWIIRSITLYMDFGCRTWRHDCYHTTCSFYSVVIAAITMLGFFWAFLEMISCICMSPDTSPFVVSPIVLHLYYCNYHDYAAEVHIGHHDPIS